MAALKVERYFDQLVAGKIRLRPLPSALGDAAARALPYQIHDAGVNSRGRAGHGDQGQGRLGGAEGPDAAGAGRPADPGRRRTHVPAASSAPVARRPATPAPPGRTARDSRDVDAGPRSLALALHGPVGKLGARRRSGPTAAAPLSADPSPARRRLRRMASRGRRRPPRGSGQRPAHRPADTTVDGGPGGGGRGQPAGARVAGGRGDLFAASRRGEQLPDDAGLARRSSASRSSSSIVDEELLVQQAQRDTSHQGDRPGDRRRRRAAGAQGARQLQLRGGLQGTSSRRPGSGRRRSTAAGSPTSSAAPRFQNRLIDKLRTDGKLKPVSPTEQEMRSYFDEQKGQLGTRPATISFRQIVITPQPSAGGQGADPGPGGLDRRWSCGAAPTSPPPPSASRRTRGRKDQGGSLNWFRRGVMVPGVRAGGVRAQARRGLGPGGVAVRLPHHPGRAGPAGRGPGPAHPAGAGDRLGPRGQRAGQGRLGAEPAALRGASFDSLQRIYHDPSAEREAENVPVDKLPETYAKVDRRGGLGHGRPGLRGPGRGRAGAVRRPAGHRPPARRATSATRTSGTGSASSSASSSRSGGTSTGCAGRRTWRSEASAAMATRPRIAITLGDPRGIGPEITARALGAAARRGDHAGRCGGPDRGDAGRGTGVGGHWGLGSGERAGDRARVIRAGPDRRPRGRDRGQAGARGRGGRDRHRAGAQARAAPGGLSLSRSHRMAGPARGRRGRRDDAGGRASCGWCWSRPTCRSGTCRRCSRWSGYSRTGRITTQAHCATGGGSRAAARGVRGEPARRRERACSATRRSGCSAPRPRRWARRGRCRRTRSSCARCGGSSTRCSRRITTWG